MLVNVVVNTPVPEEVENCVEVVPLPVTVETADITVWGPEDVCVSVVVPVDNDIEGLLSAAELCTNLVSGLGPMDYKRGTDVALGVVVDVLPLLLLPLPAAVLLVALMVSVTLLPTGKLVTTLLFPMSLELLLEPELLEPPLAPLPFPPLLPLFPGVTEVTGGASLEDASAVPAAETEDEEETGVGRGDGAPGWLTGPADGDASNFVLLPWVAEAGATGFVLPGAGEAGDGLGLSGLLGVELPLAVVCARVADDTTVVGGGISVGDTVVVGDTTVVGDAEVTDDVIVEGDAVVVDCATVVDDARSVEDAGGADDASVGVDASVEVDADVVGSVVPLIQRRKLCTTARKPNGDSHRRRQQTARRGRIRSCC